MECLPSWSLHFSSSACSSFKPCLILCLFLHSYTYVCVCIHTYTYTHTHTYAYTHIHTHIYHLLNTYVLCIKILIYVYLLLYKTCMYVWKQAFLEYQLYATDKNMFIYIYNMHIHCIHLHVSTSVYWIPALCLHCARHVAEHSLAEETEENAVFIRWEGP